MMEYMHCDGRRKCQSTTKQNLICQEMRYHFTSGDIGFIFFSNVLAPFLSNHEPAKKVKARIVYISEGPEKCTQGDGRSTQDQTKNIYL